MDDMHIAIICPKVPSASGPSVEFSGAALRAIRLGQIFSRLGHTVTIVCSTEHPRAADGIDFAFVGAKRGAS